LGSSNGTYHNNERVQEGQLAPGDTIRIGPVTFMVQIDGVPSDEEMQPAALPEAQPAEEPAGEAGSTGHPAEGAHGAADAEDLSVFLSDESAAGTDHDKTGGPGLDSAVDLSDGAPTPAEGSVFEMEEHHDKAS
jgi:hypothetical protein